MKRPRSPLRDIEDDPEKAIFERDPNEVVKVLLQQEPEKTAALLGRFEKISKSVRQFVQGRQLWMLLFQRAFPQHYDDAAVPVRLEDGRVVIGMKQDVKDMLDRYSQRPGREETYWKRYYEFMTWVPKPYGRGNESLMELKIPVSKKPTGLVIFKTRRPDRFYLLVMLDEEETYKIDLSNGRIQNYDKHPDDATDTTLVHLAFIGEHYGGFIDDTASKKGIFVWKTYDHTFLKNWIQFEIAKDGISIKVFFQYFRMQSTMGIIFSYDDDDEKYWSSVVGGYPHDFFDVNQCFLYRHKNPLENVVYVTPKYVDSDENQLLGEYSRWAYMIRLDKNDDDYARVPLVQVDDSVIGEQIVELLVEDNCWFRWTNFYGTEEYFYNFNHRLLYKSPLREDPKVLVSAHYCEHCEDAKANFVEKNKGVLFCSRECQVLYYA
jgi:hypothetical protein